MKFVFLDRDGTINVDNHYVFRPEHLSLVPGSAQAISSLKKAGYCLAVVSNQSAVGRGLATVTDVEQTNAELQRLLFQEDSNAAIEYFFYCPHRPDETCCCRKPQTGLLENLTVEHEIDLARSWVVGDKLSDLEFGANLGIPFKQRLLVLTGHVADELEKAHGSGEVIPVYFDSLPAAAAAICASSD